MNTYTLDLGAINGKVCVAIQPKKIKNVHLKVYRTLNVSLNLPHKVPSEWIVNFLEKRKSWIDKQITKYKAASGYNDLHDLKNGSSTQFLGKDIRIIQQKSNDDKLEIVAEEKTIIIYLKEENDSDKFNKIFQSWWRKQAYNVFSEELAFLYNKIFKKYSIPFPALQIRKMNTLWGSCIKKRNKIVLNEYLLKADKLCIQYVVLHELTHLLYDKHNADFYNFLTIQMPDWKLRKNRLDKEVVNGL
ncbi:MAG: M48 family metallopeptidase [Fibromonadales bacterium]|nr:M48 family metallopeptidase [Fibromonadales bacterium]